MKNAIRNYFKTDRSHASGAALVIQFSKRLALKKQINIQPESSYMLGVIHEELRELGGISPAEMKGLLSTPVVKPSAVVAEVKAEPEILTTEAPKVKTEAIKGSRTKTVAVKKGSRKK